MSSVGWGQVQTAVPVPVHMTVIRRQKPIGFLRRKGSYGVDAPYLLPIPLVLIALNILSAVTSRSLWPLPTLCGLANWALAGAIWAGECGGADLGLPRT
jgi:hypothetical protein